MSSQTTETEAITAGAQSPARLTFTRTRALLTLLVLGGCGGPADPSTSEPDAPARTAEVISTGRFDESSSEGRESARDRAGLDGWWQTDGYGFTLEVRGDDLRLWQVTAVSCIPSYTGHRLASQPGGAVGVGFELDVGIRLTIKPGPSASSRKMRTEGSVIDWGLERIASLPSQCDQPTSSDPVSVFDVFWTTYAENYPFSVDKGVDWNAIGAQYRPQVNEATTPEQLFEILSAMTRPLHDMHTHIFTDVGSYDGWRPDTEPYSQALLDRFVQIVEQRDVGRPLQSWAGGRVSFADLPGGIGYLRITAFDFGTEDADADAIEMDRILDEIFTVRRVARQRGLIVDIRVSTGGHNPLGLQVAARLTRRPYLAYSTVARRPQPDSYTSPEFSWVRPDQLPVFTGPVVLLTSSYTVSAHEVFTQALIGRTPEVVRMGENTQGAISDHHFRSLPNGWVFTLPNQRFFTKGLAYDGAGVPPHIRIPVITPDEMERGEDAAFARAVALLGSPRHP